MNDHDDMTNADVMSADEIAEYDRADEFALDAANDARNGELADAAEASLFESGHTSEEEPW